MDYKKILEGVVDIINTTEKSDIGFANICTYIGENCPELKESEDEKIRKEIVEAVEFHKSFSQKKKEYIYAWLEKQGEQSQKTSIWKHWRDGICGNGEGKLIYLIKNGYDYSLSSCLCFECDYIELSELDNLMLEKQGKQEQLYIRFGEIPSDEKSKIYQGEIEVETENGVSVYPAFKTSEGDIVLGLSLPITKTTLYTQQHLIEYDDRPCYLVKGDYVGKDTDGQPLINNVSIIEKIGKYRVREKKQDEQKPADKVEPKFKVGDWVVCNNGPHHIFQVIERSWPNAKYRNINGTEIFLNVNTLDKQYHLWTIQDAKDGDVLSFNDGRGNDCIELIKSITDKKIEFWFCLTNGNRYEVFDGIIPYTNLISREDATPATKEQRDLLFQKMKEAGYEWDAEKKELKKINPKFNVDDIISNGISEVKIVSIGKDNYTVTNGEIENDAHVGNWVVYFKDQDNWKLVEQKSAWSEEDKKMSRFIGNAITANDAYMYLKSRGVQVADVHLWLNKFKERYTWRPSDEQMRVLDLAIRCGINRGTTEETTLVSLFNDLKKLRGE